jgi:hypothetical protein
MNGELAQIIALVAHGNRFLHEGSAAVAPDLLGNSTFQYVSSVRFARYANRSEPKGVEVAASVKDWFASLRAAGVRRLWNIAFGWQKPDLPEHQATAFVNGVARAIQADLPEGFELWYPKWEPGGPQARPWTVEYRCLLGSRSSAMPLANLQPIKGALRRSLEQAEAFARRPEAKLTKWVDWFVKARQLLDAEDSQPPFHPDMLPGSGFTLEARQTVAAATQAFVFAGQGSWNDFGSAEAPLQKEYELVSRELYSAIKAALVMASNSSAPLPR